MKGIFNSSNITFELSIRGIKMITIGIYFALASIMGYILGNMLNKIFIIDTTNTEDNDKHTNTKSKTELTLYILAHLVITGIIAYIANQFIQLLPFPFEGWKGINPPQGFKGFEINKVTEAKSPYPIIYFMMYCNTSLRNKVDHLTTLLYKK